jgi:type VI secretion system secreted protein Hcp
MSQADYFLKIDGITGECDDHKHAKEMQLQSWSWGETNSGSSGLGGGAGSGKVSMQDFHFVIDYSLASPDLFISCATGKHIPLATLTCRKAGGEQHEYLIVKFTDILISSYQSGGSQHGGSLPTEQVSFNFTKVEIGYAPQKKDGQLDAMKWKGYDVKKNQQV